jgi:hypothetical protein
VETEVSSPCSPQLPLGPSLSQMNPLHTLTSYYYKTNFGSLFYDIFSVSRLYSIDYGWVGGWLVDWVVGWVVVWLVGWLVGCLVGFSWLVGW